MHCSERRDYNHPLYDEAGREYAAVSSEQTAVALLKKAAPFVGWVANREPMVAGVNSDKLCDEIDAFLAQIGGQP
jgi:hypothetical protein